MSHTNQKSVKKIEGEKPALDSQMVDIFRQLILGKIGPQELKSKL
jgi:hypothetical protein